MNAYCGVDLGGRGIIKKNLAYESKAVGTYFKMEGTHVNVSECGYGRVSVV